MPANLPPHYYEAEKRFRQAKAVPEKVAALQEMISATPKHKGTDHLRADQRARMARLMEELKKPSNTRSGGPQPFSIRKEGAGQAALIGLPNSGKSQLLISLTGAGAKVAPYAFTTREPLPGTLVHANVRVQMIDTPAINDQNTQTRLFGLLRNADLLVIALDLSADPAKQMSEVSALLERWGFLLLERGRLPDPDDHRVAKRALLVGTKADETGALDQFQELERALGERYPLVLVSAQEEFGLDELGDEILRSLDRVRVYTKAPGEDPDYSSPIVLVRGSSVEDAAKTLHKDWRQRLKYAVLWGSGKFEGQRIGREYVLTDGDILEFHG